MAARTAIPRGNRTNRASMKEASKAVRTLAHVLRENATRTARLRMEVKTINSERGTPRKRSLWASNAADAAVRKNPQKFAKFEDS